MTESSYLRYPHVARDLVTFAAQDDVWLAALSAMACCARLRSRSQSMKKELPGRWM